MDHLYGFGIERSMNQVNELERQLQAKEGTVTPTADSPERFETPQRYADLRTERGPGELTMMTTPRSLVGTVSNTYKALHSLFPSRSTTVDRARLTWYKTRNY